MKYENLRVLIVDPDRQAQAAVRLPLHDCGCRTFYVAATRAEAESVLNEGPIDLLFTEATLGDGPAGPMVRAIRLGTVGEDPFLPIIATLSVPDPALVRGIVDDGPDDVLIKPLSGKTVSDRILRIVNNRKPFVVTRDYLGPDRRAKVRADSEQAPTFHVPNRLKGVLEGTFNKTNIKAAIAASKQELLNVRVASQARAVVFVLNRVLPEYLQDGEANEKWQTPLDEVVALSENALALVAETRYADQAPAFQTVLTAIGEIRQAGDGAPSRPLEELQRINGVLQRNFRPS